MTYQEEVEKLAITFQKVHDNIVNLKIKTEKQDIFISKILSTLKDAHPFITDDAVRARVGELITKVEG